MQDWLAVGNGWRNLYLLSCGVQALALGTFFASRRLWFTRGRFGAFLAGASLTPLVQYLWMLLLALFWPFAPKWVYIGVLPLAACLWLAWAVVRRAGRLRSLAARGWAWVQRLCRLDKPALASLCFALALGVLLAPIVVRITTSASSAQADSSEYMALGLRYCEDRNLTELMDKDDPTGHFRGNAHFPSLELHMAYGLMHAGDTVGYPYDKPLFTGVGLLSLYLLMAYAALLIRLTRGDKRWVLLGLMLFNLVPNLVYSLALAPRDTWRCLAIMVGALGLFGTTPAGGWKQYLGKLAFVTALCFTVMSAHVVNFVVLPFVVVAWVAYHWLTALYRRDGQAGRTLLRAAGLALGGAAGTVGAYAGNLWCYLKWGTMSPWRLMTTYTDAPWFTQYMQTEYKLDITTTHLNFWKARYDIVMAYATPIGIWGMRLALIGLLVALVALVLRRLRLRREVRALSGNLPRADGPVAVFVAQSPQEQSRAARVSAVLAAATLTLFTLAPMTGLLDTRLYSFSGSFLTMQRYTLQWYLFAAAAIVAVLAAAAEEWPMLLHWYARKGPRLTSQLRNRAPKAAFWARKAPALLCSFLCLYAFAYGTQESGYANSIYRYGRPMLSDEGMALDSGFRQRYDLLLQLQPLVGDTQKVLLTRPGYQYALRAKGYILTANSIVPLLNLPLAEVETALKAMGVAALCTEPDFWDERYYALSTLNEYLSSLPAAQIVDDGHMRVYLMDKSLIGKLKPAAETAPQ